MEQLGFLDHFNNLNDPRLERTKLHSMEEILLATVCSVICGAEGWNDVELFCQTKINFLRTFFPYKNGAPSDDTFRRFFRALNPDTFQQCFIAWINSLDISIPGHVIAIDGKTSRRSHDADKRALHMVSAFATEARLVLGQERCDEKSNEITAIPALLKLLDIRGAIISIDAMGCQKNIAAQIINQQGDYILGLKGNQRNLHEDVVQFFADNALLDEMDEYEETDGGHGRIEVRKCRVTQAIDGLKRRHAWKGMRSIIEVQSFVTRDGKTTEQTRYYISSLDAGAKKIAGCIRSHWAIENSLHWVLDMSFGDDQGRIRKKNAPQNMAIIKHITLNMIRAIQQKRQSIKGLRKAAGWDNQILQNIIAQKI